MFAVPPRLRRLSRRAALIAGASLGLALGSCSDEGSGPVVVSVIGSRTELAKPLQNLPNPAAKLILEATAQGLVAACTPVLEWSPPAPAPGAVTRGLAREASCEEIRSFPGRPALPLAASARRLATVDERADVVEVVLPQ